MQFYEASDQKLITWRSYWQSQNYNMTYFEFSWTVHTASQISELFFKIIVATGWSRKVHSFNSQHQPASVPLSEIPLFLFLSPFGLLGALPLLLSWGEEGKIRPTLQKIGEDDNIHNKYFKQYRGLKKG